MSPARPPSLSVPDGGAPRAAVEPEVHVAVHQVDGDEVAALGVVAVQQRPVGQRGSKGHLELGEGQVALGGLGPGHGRVRPQRLVEEGQQQGESCGGTVGGREEVEEERFKQVLRSRVSEKLCFSLARSKRDRVLF